ncbi:MAG: sulfatase [Bacteroidota bacterium]
MRINLLTYFLFLPLMFLLACENKPPESKALPKKKYNILMVVADDLNDYGIFHTYPNAVVPNLDGFGKTAITFRHSYCASPECNPSRAAFLSGLYPHHTGAYLNGGKPWIRVMQDVVSLPEHLKDNGYTTFGMGKLFHGEIPKEKEAYAWDNEVKKGGFGPFPEKDEYQVSRFFSYKAWEGPDSDFPDVRNGDAVVEFLNQEHDQPFFCMYGLWRPHTPFTAPKRFFEQYELEDIPLPPGYLENDNEDISAKSYEILDMWDRFSKAGPTNVQLWKEFIHAYLACTSFADWSFGRALKALDEGPNAENTIVIFFSDNGYHCGEKESWEKSTLWEQAALVPTMIRFPGSSENGKVCTKPINLIDLYPTLIEACGLQGTPHELDGNSLVPLFQNVETEWNIPSFTSFGKGFASVRTEKFRYLQYPDGTEELYDHHNDQYEFKNVADEPQFKNIKENLKSHVPKEWAEELQSDKWDQIRAKKKKQLKAIQ